MKFFLLASSLFLTLLGVGQGIKPIKGSARHKLLANDSVVLQLKEMKDSAAKTLQQHDSVAEVQENMDQHMDYLVRLQKEQRAKQKKAAFIRIGIGLAMLVVLIIGLRRRKRGPSQNL